MVYPLSASSEGIKLKPELMEAEKLYHCIFLDKIMLVYKDSQEVLHCYEIEEKDLVDKVKNCQNTEDVEKIFEDYVNNQNMNN